MPNYMKNILLVLVGFILFSFTSVSHLGGPINELCSVKNNTFVDGEQLVYKAYYNWGIVWIPAGEAVFNIKENKDSYEITIDAKSYPSYDSFFKVRDYYYTKVDKETLYPTNFVRIIEEGKYRKYDSIAFDQKLGIAKSFNGKSKETVNIKEFQMSDCMQDLVSILYFLRNTNVEKHKKGDFIPTGIFIDEEVHPIKVTYDGKEKNKKIKDLGKFNTIRVIPDLVAGEVFKEGDKMKIWVSDDGNKIPLLIESPVSVGSVKAVLKSYSGLRHPLTSKK